jgi:hypothetical protein
MNVGLGHRGDRVQNIFVLALKLFFKPVVEATVISLSFTCS